MIHTTFTFSQTVPLSCYHLFILFVSNKTKILNVYDVYLSTQKHMLPKMPIFIEKKRISFPESESQRHLKGEGYRKWSWRKKLSYEYSHSKNMGRWYNFLFVVIVPEKHHKTMVWHQQHVKFCFELVTTRWKKLLDSLTSIHWQTFFFLFWKTFEF